jgi:hypothetical protein
MSIEVIAAFSEPKAEKRPKTVIVNIPALEKPDVLSASSVARAEFLAVFLLLPSRRRVQL